MAVAKRAKDELASREAALRTLLQQERDKQLQVVTALRTPCKQEHDSVVTALRTPFRQERDKQLQR